MKQNNTFSQSRIWMLIRWDLAMNRKRYVWLFWGLYIAFLLVLLFQSCMWDEGVCLVEGKTYEECLAYAQFSVARSVVGGSLLLFYVVALFVASRFLKQMETKEGATAFLMLPASNLEKFVYRCLFVTVFFLLLGGVAFFLADLARYLLLPLLDVNQEVQRMFLTDDFLYSARMWMFGSSVKANSAIVWMRPWGYLLFSLSVLGGAYWSRLAWARVLVGVSLIVWGTPEIMKHLMPDDVSAVYFLSEWVSAALWVVNILCCFLAYRVFRRSQIV